MRTLGLVLAGSLLAAPAVAGPLQAPIVGGTTATVGQFPTTVALELGGGLCTGTLLNQDWVLTAAHCIDPAVLGQSQAQITASLRVHFDTVNIFTSAGIVVRATEIIKHPLFNVNALGTHDIGLIRLATPVTDRAAVPIILDAAKVPLGTELQLVGFGATSRTNPSTAGVLRLVDQTSVSCSFVGLSDASLICWSQTNGRGKCEGDSGGPSFAMIEGQLAQVGIASFADQQCAQLGADTRIAAETAFLYEHVPALQCAADGACAAACGQGALPADPDCGCDADHPCPDGHECFQEACIVAPFAPGGVGSECADGTDCQSGVCAASGDQSLCVLACTAGADDACPSGFSCREAAGGGGGVCWPSDDSGGCCSTGGGGGAATSLVGLALVAFGLRRRRR
ncbi:MAG: serine protease [Myxococcales bacterium]|nr:serine protease [Myxococcales bacterium]